jgi:hypothetical protein
LKFVMNALAISPLSLHENETKDNEPVWKEKNVKTCT